MAGGYLHRPPGTDGVAGLVKDLQRQIDAIRSGAGIRSAVIRDSQMIFTTADGEGIGTFGTFPYSSLNDDLQRNADVAKGALFEADDGQNLLMAVQYESDGSTEAQLGADIILIRASEYGDFISTGDLRLRAGAGTAELSSEDDVLIDGDTGVQINSGGNLRIFELSTTGSAASLRLDPATAEILWVSSSRRYKTDIADAEVDLADVLALRPRTWADKAAIEKAEPDTDLRRDVGFIAEELDEIPSMRQFVDYDEDGEPQAIQYDRLTVALLAVIKDQQARLDSIEERLTNLEGDRT